MRVWTVVCVTASDSVTPHLPAQLSEVSGGVREAGIAGGSVSSHSCQHTRENV